MKCSCGGAMTAGFIPDHAAAAAIWVTMFVEGKPEARGSLWEKLRKGHGVADWKEEAVWAMSAHRCGECGKVELYAKERPDPNLHGHNPL